MKVVLFGATGMIGSGVLLECLADDRVTQLLVVGRKTCGTSDPKLREILRNDFYDYRDVTAELTGYDACFFCLGVSSVGMTEADYTRLTFDLTIAAAGALVSANPGMKLCYVSGEHADGTEKGRVMWARVKGRTENRLLRMALNAWMFRPGYVQPGKGVRSKTAWYQAFYFVMSPLYPLLKRMLPRHVTSTSNVGRAMISVVEKGYDSRVLENPDINALAGSA